LEWWTRSEVTTREGGTLMPDTNLLLFVSASLALIIVPGPDMIYVLTRGVSQGRSAGLVSAAGVCSGVLVHTAFAAVGLSAILARSAAAFSVVKYAGAAYLVYLGIRAILDREKFAAHGRVERAGLAIVFRQGVLSNVLNPKVALFFLAFLPQFVDPATGATGLQMLAFGVAFTFMGLVVLSVVALFSGALGEWLRSRPSFAGALRWLTGSVLVGLGLRLAFPERR
ncbi:MAG: LysE family translocator, partial [Rubrobacter sp.]